MAGDRVTAGYDPLREKFFVITRIPGRRIRTCGLWESADGEQFEHVGEIVAPDEGDPARTEIYGMVRFPYGGMHVGMIEMFYIPQRKLNAQLVYSRDGVNWNRPEGRATFLDWGPPGSWDRAWVFPSHNAPIRVGEKLYIFYQGRQTLHWAVPPFGHVGSVGLAMLRPDGFASIEPIEPLNPRVTDHAYQGTTTTVPLMLDGRRLHVNGVARPGSIRVAVLDVDGEPIKGFTVDDVRPIRMTDSLDIPVEWTSGRSLAELADQPVRLRFHLQGAKMYSFWMEP
jgi:hypothetical protein